MKKSVGSWCGVYLLLLSLTLPPAFSQQVSGIISGSIRDSSGAALVGAEIKIFNIATSAERAIVTDGAGDFVVGGLDPGEYSLRVQAQGFKTLESKGIVLTASERLSIGTLSLELGNVGESVTVTAQGAAVQTASAERSASITTSQIEGLLIYGRTVTSLLALAPGVVDPVGAAGRSIGGTNSTNFNVLGNRNSANNISVDGITMTASGGAPNATFGVSMESVSEVKLLISNYQAEYGRLSGSNVEIITKSGTREYHGMGMYYMRNEALNANNFFNNRLGIKRPVNRFNAVTYNIGGPVYIPKLNTGREKLFFFWNQEYVPNRSTGAVQTSTMPTALERAGNFSQSFDVSGRLIPVVDPTTRAPFPGNIIPANRIDPNGQILLNVFPLPNFLNTAVSKGAYNYISQLSGKQPLWLNTLKLDYNIRSSDSLTFSFAPQFSSDDTPNGGLITAPYVAVNAVTHTMAGMTALHYRHIFSPTLINEVTVGYTYTFGPIDIGPDTLKSIQRSTYGFSAGQLNPGGNPLGLIPGMTFGGLTGATSLVYDPRFPSNGSRNFYDISDNVSMTVGAHTLKAGMFLEKMRQRDGLRAPSFTGDFDFGVNVNNPLNTGHPFANAILGVFNSYTESTNRPISKIYARGADGFVQDTWRATRRLTLDLGVRISWYENFWNYNNAMAGFSPQRYDPTQQVQLIRPALNNGARAGMSPVTGQFYPASLIGFIAPGSGNPTNGMVVTSQDPSYPRSLINNIGPVAAPRIGFAYDPFGDGKTAIRGGFGVFYNRAFGGVASSAGFSYPIVQTPVVQFGTIATFRSAQGFNSAPAVIGFERDMKPPSVMNLSFAIQRNIGFGTVLDVAYVGSLGRHLTWQRNLNSIPLGTRFLTANADPTNPRVPLPDVFLTPIRGYSSIGYDEAAGTSNYHSLQVTANRRFASNFEFGLAWTWSKALDFTDSEFGVVNTIAPFRAWNYGLASFDRTSVVKVNLQWDVPKRDWGFAPAKLALNGWHVSGILTYSSGAPVAVGYTQVTPVDLSGTPGLTPRIAVIGDPVLSRGERTFSQAFRTSVFHVPAVGTLGQQSKTLLRGPGINNADIAIFKNIPIWERVRVQFRSEFYNLFNHTQFSAFDATARFDASGNNVNSQFGQYTAARDPRIIQLALRFEF